MAYHNKTKASVKSATPSLGVRLGKLAIKHEVTVQEIATTTGASRGTIYSWFKGGAVSNAYLKVVKGLVETLKTK
jgi:hypothetical protein